MELEKALRPQVEKLAEQQVTAADSYSVSFYC
jgi:hypothetical protein